MSTQTNGLVRLLRGLGVVNFAAAIAVVAPRTWLAGCHAAMGLGSFPTEPIAGYLARTTSLWFASFGVLLWFIARDVQHYAGLITFLGVAMLIQGSVVIAIDWYEGMPAWWIAVEGPTCVLLATAILGLLRRSPRP